MNDPELPHATTSESKQQREDWMLLEPSAPVIPLQTPPLHSIDHSNSLTEGYGENTASGRTSSGGVDFFSSLGTERRRKDNNKANLETVCNLFHSTLLYHSQYSRLQRLVHGN